MQFTYKLVCYPIAFHVLFLSFLLSFSSKVIAFEGNANIVVLYPEVKEPYLKIFNEAIKGLESVSNLSVRAKSIKKKDNVRSIHRFITKEKPKAIVAFGRRSLSMIQGMSYSVPIISAASLSVFKEIDDIVMTVAYVPDPIIMFELLKKIFPEVRKVHVVIKKSNWDWLLKYTADKMRSMSLSLEVHEANSLQESARIYRKLLKEIKVENECLWLPQDRKTIDKKNIIPMILKSAWNKEIVVLSSNLSHVDKGVLFGMYPDNYKMGVYIGNKLKKILSGNEVIEPVQPLRQLKSAINFRTVKHMGLEIKPHELEIFDLKFPKGTR